MDSVRSGVVLVALHFGVEPGYRGGIADGIDPSHHAGCVHRELRLVAGEGFTSLDDEEIGAEGIDLGEQIGSA